MNNCEVERIKVYCRVCDTIINYAIIIIIIIRHIIIKYQTSSQLIHSSSQSGASRRFPRLGVETPKWLPRTPETDKIGIENNILVDAAKKKKSRAVFLDSA